MAPEDEEKTHTVPEQPPNLGDGPSCAPMPRATRPWAPQARGSPRNSRRVRPSKVTCPATSGIVPTEGLESQRPSTPRIDGDVPASTAYVYALPNRTRAAAGIQQSAESLDMPEAPNNRGWTPYFRI